MRKSGMNLLGIGKTVIKNSICLAAAQPLIIQEAIDILRSEKIGDINVQHTRRTMK